MPDRALVRRMISAVLTYGNKVKSDEAFFLRFGLKTHIEEQEDDNQAANNFIAEMSKEELVKKSTVFNN